MVVSAWVRQKQIILIVTQEMKRSTTKLELNLLIYLAKFKMQTLLIRIRQAAKEENA